MVVYRIKRCERRETRRAQSRIETWLRAGTVVGLPRRQREYLQVEGWFGGLGRTARGFQPAGAALRYGLGMGTLCLQEGPGGQMEGVLLAERRGPSFLGCT